MKPILFPEGQTSFNTNVIGRLSDAISCTVTEERNGQYELHMEYPIDGQLMGRSTTAGLLWQRLRIIRVRSLFAFTAFPNLCRAWWRLTRRQTRSRLPTRVPLVKPWRTALPAAKVVTVRLEAMWAPVATLGMPAQVPTAATAELAVTPQEVRVAATAVPAARAATEAQAALAATAAQATATPAQAALLAAMAQPYLLVLRAAAASCAALLYCCDLAPKVINDFKQNS